MKKKLLTLLGALLLVCSLPISGIAESKQLFPDVPDTKHFAEAVNDLAARNIIGGYPDGLFKPSNSITRGQAAAIIAKVIQLDTTNVKNPEFTDVSTKHGSYKAIAAMVEKGIIGGYPDGSYRPNDPINRKNMASILVKAFDLPRDYDVKNPFKDPSGITSDVLIIYKLGITTGTTPTTFSPNASITRGQAAKMIKASEDMKPTNMYTLKASDIGWEKIMSVNNREVVSENPGLFKVLLIKGKEGYREDQVQFTLLKEGTGSVILEDWTDGKRSAIKYYVHIEKDNDELKATLEETKDLLPTEVMLYDAKEPIDNISLTTMDGKLLSENLGFTPCTYSGTCFTIDKPGEYIATVQYTTGEQERYGIEVKEQTNSFFYEIHTVKEQTSVVYSQEEKYNIGKHTIEKNHEKIATVTRDPGTNVFHITAKDEGVIGINFENQVNIGRTCDDPNETGDCITLIVTGFYINVERIGSIIGVSTTTSHLPDA